MILFIIRFANALYDSNPQLSNISITISSLIYQDFVTTVKTLINSSNFTKDCTTIVGNNITYESYITNKCINPSIETINQFQSLIDTKICIAAIKEVIYTVNHQATAVGMITSVSADIIITDIPMPSKTLKAVTIAQSFGVLFLSNISNTITQTNGNIIKRKRSGNPGYLISKPLLFGTLIESVNTSISYIGEYINGLTYLSSFSNYNYKDPSNSNKGNCPTKDNIQYNIEKSINYGYDFITGCTISLNRTEIKNLCCQGSSSCQASDISEYSSIATGIPYIFNFTPGYVCLYVCYVILFIKTSFFLYFCKSLICLLCLFCMFCERFVCILKFFHAF